MASLQPGHVIAGRYRIERPLSRGGMGSVWEAQHLELGMRVALKLMDGHIAATDDGRARFAREAKAAAAIQSPHVVKVHDYGVDGETPYLVMELLEGENLGARLRRVGRLGLAETAHLVVQMAKGLRRAHDAGIVHRDLKPANVFLVRCDEDEIVQILDFGLAKQLRAQPGDGNADSTASGVVLGSMHYMSPEQARGYKTIDHRTDLWSLGVIVYRALTGEVPFPGNEIGDVLVKVCTDPIPCASARIPGLDPALARQVDAFFARALARDPAARFPSARELAAALGQLAGLGANELRESVVSPQADPLRDAPTQVTAMPGRVGVASQGITPEPEASFKDVWAGAPPPRPPKASRNLVIAGAFAGVMLLGAAGVGVMQLRDAPAPKGALSEPAPPSVAPTAVETAAATAAPSATDVPTVTPAPAPSASASARPAPSAARPGGDRVKRKFGF